MKIGIYGKIQVVNKQIGESNKPPRKKWFVLLAILFPIASLAFGYSLFEGKSFSSEKKEISEKNLLENKELEEERGKNSEDGLENEDVKRKSAINEIKNALESYHSDHNGYPISGGTAKLNDENSFVYKELIKYSNAKTLKDSKDPEFYYGYKSDGASFELSARLENSEDENCEILGESLCIHKIDSFGKTSKKKYGITEVLTVEDPSSFLMEKLKMVDDDKEDTIIATSDIIGNSEKSTLEMRGTGLAGSIKIKKASEISREELGSYNLVLCGSPQSNNVIEEILKKTVLADIVEGSDAEKNSIKMAVKFAQNPWNNEKIVLILETDYSMGLNLSIRGVVKVEKRGDFHHIAIQTDSGKIYALVISSDGSGFFVENLSEFDGKYAEVKGYERIRDSEKFPIEDSIGVTDIRILE